MKNIVKLGAILFLITAIAGGILAFANDLTKDKIAQLAAEASDDARKEVFKDADGFKEVDSSKLKKITASNENVLEVHNALNSSDEVVGYVLKTVSKEGYGGNVEVIIGISLEGELLGVKVGQNTETPGLGTNATKPEFQGQFKGQSTGVELEVVKSAPGTGQIQALTGATITSKAVTGAVNSAIEAYGILSE